jgi:hypothetical protein
MALRVSVGQGGAGAVGQCELRARALCAQTLGVDLRLGAGGVGWTSAGIGSGFAHGMITTRSSQLGPDRLVVDVDRGSLQTGGVEHLHDLVAVQLAALDQGLGDAQDLLAVVADEADGGDVCLAEDLGGGAALAWVGEDGGDRIAGLAHAGGAVHDLRADALEALHVEILGLLALLLAVKAPAI